MPLIFFGINFGAACFCIWAGMSIRPNIQNGHDYIAAIGGLVMGSILAVTELLVWSRCSMTLNMLIARSWLGMGVLWFVADVTAVYEGLQKGWPADFEWFVLFLGLLSAYCVVCGIYRIRCETRGTSRCT